MEEMTALPEIDWSVISSGVDFLESAVEHLAGGTERDLRYAALHLSTAMETLLKAQLARADWKLVFEDVKKADRVAYQTGDLKSVRIRAALLLPSAAGTCSTAAYAARPGMGRSSTATR
jgi:hypothetical protein